jgi:hypothetical protein
VAYRSWLCESDGEFVDHLLLHCVVVRALWNAFFTRFGICWVMPCTVKELYASWWTGGRSRSAVVGKWFLFALCGVFGGSVMIDALRTRQGLIRSYSIFSFLLFSPRLWVGWPATLRVISFADFLSLFSSSL